MQDHIKSETTLKATYLEDDDVGTMFQVKYEPKMLSLYQFCCISIQGENIHPIWEDSHRSRTLSFLIAYTITIPCVMHLCFLMRWQISSVLSHNDCSSIKPRHTQTSWFSRQHLYVKSLTGYWNGHLDIPHCFTQQQIICHLNILWHDEC